MNDNIETAALPPRPWRIIDGAARMRENGGDPGESQWFDIETADGRCLCTCWTEAGGAFAHACVDAQATIDALRKRIAELEALLSAANAGEEAAA